MTWQQKNVKATTKILLLLWQICDFPDAAKKLKIHHFQGVDKHICSIDKKNSVQQGFRSLLVLAEKIK
jgi:hypothetical protein